jgi:hypothetical protein
MFFFRLLLPLAYWRALLRQNSRQRQPLLFLLPIPYSLSPVACSSRVILSFGSLGPRAASSHGVSRAKDLLFIEAHPLGAPGLASETWENESGCRIRCRCFSSSLFPIPYSLFPVAYSLFPIPHSLVPCFSRVILSFGSLGPRAASSHGVSRAKDLLFIDASAGCPRSRF